MQVDFLESQEAMISTNESHILNRLKAVEKSPEKIIKVSKHNFMDPLEVITTDFTEYSSPSANNLSQPNTPKTLFNTEINVTENMLTGKSQAASVGSGYVEEFTHHTGLKVYEDDSNCLHALSFQQDSQAQKYVTELSSSEVEELLRSVTMYSQPEHQSYLQHISSYDEPYQNQKETFEGHYGSYVHKDSIIVEDINHRENWQRRPHDEHSYNHCPKTNCKLGYYYNNQKDCHYTSCQIRNCHCILQHQPTTHSTIRFRSKINESRSNGYPDRWTYDQKEACLMKLCHAATGFVPDEEKLKCCYPLHSKTDNQYDHCTALYSDPAHCSRVHSPLCEDDNPYTILHSTESSEPITAIFMGFHTAQDDSEQVQEFEDSLKAELVIIEERPGEDGCMKDIKKCYQVPEGSSTKRNQGVLYGVREQWSLRRVQLGFKNMKEKQRPCCTMC